MIAKISIWAAIALVLVGSWVTFVFLRDLNRARERVSGKGTVISSPYGDIEFTEGGVGPAVLVIHGSGGGYDQGELIEQAVLGDDFHWIAPSRFGYLRSALPSGATWDDQADAYAVLLDHLGIEKVAVVAMSQGGPSALLFAVFHPDRVSSLTLVSCGVAPSAAAAQESANQKGNTLATIFEHDFLYWLITKLFKKRFMELIGADETVIAGLSAEQRLIVERFVDEMMPVSLRSAGVAFDNKATLPGERIAAITAPTLVVHAVDDTLQLFHNAEFAIATIPNAKLLRFERGGHIVVAVEQSAVRDAVQKHILAYSEALSGARP